MVKFGIELLKHVYVKITLLGMVTSVNVNKTVQVVDYIILNIKYAFAQMDKDGMELLVLLDNLVAVENNGMIQVYNVIVQLHSTGMEELVFSVQMVEYGIQLPDHVFVKLVLNGMDNSVLLYKTVKVELSGIKTLGLVNVLQLLSGITYIVWLILVLEVKYGIMLLKYVFVLEIEYLSMELVYHLKQLVLMVKYGIVDY
jgi:hypothetical protein